MKVGENFKLFQKSKRPFFFLHLMYLNSFLPSFLNFAQMNEIFQKKKKGEGFQPPDPLVCQRISVRLKAQKADNIAQIF